MSELKTNHSPESIPTCSSRFPKKKRKSCGCRKTKQLDKPSGELSDAPGESGEVEDSPIDIVNHIVNNQVVDQIANLWGDNEGEAKNCDENGGRQKKPKASKTYKKIGEPFYCKSECRDGNWGERDRQRLLLALRRFGVLNMPELVKAVPGKSESEIRDYIQLNWKSSRIYLRNALKKKKGSSGTIGPVDEWLNCLKDHFTHDFYKCSPLARAILFIWKFEEHPDPKHCGGIDFKALYEHLYYLLRGFPPRELNQPTAKYLSDSLKQFSRRVKLNGWTDKKNLVTSLNVQKGARKLKTDDDVIAALSYDSKQSFEELLKRPGFNPFAIPLDVLLIKDKSSAIDDVENAETSE